MPPILPFPLALVWISGAFELMLGVLLLFNRFTILAAWGFIALLIAIFPANIYMAWQPNLFPNIPQWVLWGRLPLQGLFIVWAYAFTRKPRKCLNSA